MKPTNVSPELVQVAELALADECIKRRPERCDCPTDDQLRIVISAVFGHLLGEEVTP